MSAHDNGPQQASDAVNKAVAKVLRPLVRLLLSFDITYPRLIVLLKRLYVEVAERELADNKRPSDSRITLMTGVHRKDVARLRADDAHLNSMPDLSPNTASVGARLVAEWLANPRFRDGTDPSLPAALPFRAPPGSEMPNFTELVEKVCKQDMRPRAVLDEWLRLDIARYDDDFVTLNTQAFAPKTGLDEKAYFFGRNIQDHILAGACNLRGETPPFFDRSVYYDGLTESSINQLRGLATQLGSEALQTVNDEAYRLQQIDSQDDGNKEQQHRFNFGIFNYAECHTSTLSEHEQSDRTDSIRDNA